MIDHIVEPIDVLASFSGGHVRPRAFLWKKRRYNINQINLAYSARNGRDPIHYFAVSNENSVFKIAFRPRDMVWQLLEIYHE
jgi:hypothetical protein